MTSNKPRGQYFDSAGVPYLPNVGAKVLSLLNGVKQTIPNFAKLHGLEIKALLKVVEGKLGPTQQVVSAIRNHRPLRVRDLYPKEYQDRFPVLDDTRNGIIVCKSELTKSTERDTLRGPVSQKQLFYTYADTAMSTTSLFRPEWIAEHFFWHDIDSESIPDWAFNHGHFEHQITYFIGPVNFHWISNGRKHVRRMETGDINYITPFVPHTFTTRKWGEGLILAVTYGGAIASEEFQSKIQEISLADYLEEFGSIVKTSPRVQDPFSTDKLGGVMFKFDRDRVAVSGKADDFSELISGIPFQPHTRAFVGGNSNGNVLVNSERWGYNISDHTIVLEWTSNLSISGRMIRDSEIVEPGDSFFIQSGIVHSFKGDGRVLVIDINPKAGNPLDELRLIARYSGLKGLERVHSENTQWF